jgi:glycine/D-amino acid oxidase-like deaminating enzyme/nitrite reductase/ring-hydroxylating ferredoxin subunit
MERHESFWIDTAKTTETFPRLENDLDVDVAVVGAGIVGVLCATFLKEAGKSVALVEANRIVEGVTGHTTAKVTSLHTLVYDELIRKFGEDKARIYAQSNQSAIGIIRDLVRARQIDCDLRTSHAYTYTVDDDYVSMIEKEAESASRLGLPAKLHEDIPTPFPVKAAVGFSEQAEFHPRKFLLPLAAALPEDGRSAVFERTRVVEIEDGKPCRVITANGATVRARDVVVATHMPIIDRGLFFARVEVSRGYALVMDAPQNMIPDGMFINVGGPTHSVRSATLDGRSVLVLAGEGHPVGEAEDHRRNWDLLEAWARDEFAARDVLYRWSTQDLYPLDGLPFIGKMSRLSDHLFTGTGFSAWGMTNGVVAARLLADLITEVPNEWAELYDPRRTELSSLPSFVKKAGHDARHLIGDRLKSAPGEPAVSSLARGQGAIVEVEGEKVAVHRDDDGKLHALSAACTHLGCIVAWNDAERSWDCPCHGSRFSSEGAVLHGPAVTPLEARDLDLPLGDADDPSIEGTPSRDES